MAKKPRFTIAIPVIKGIFLAEAISSVLQQTYRDFELIIINDNSPDMIANTILSFSDKRIRYYENKKNLGKNFPTRTWNQALALAKGKYFLLLGDDDVLSLNFLTEINKLIKKYPSASVYRSLLAVTDANLKIKYYGLKPPELETWDEQLYFRFKYIRPQATCEHVCRTKDLRQLGGFYELPLAWGSDDATWISLAVKGGIATTYKTLAFWRHSRFNISTLPLQDQKVKAMHKLCSFIKKFIRKHTPHFISRDILLSAVAERESDYVYQSRSPLVNYF